MAAPGRTRRGSREGRAGGEGRGGRRGTASPRQSLSRSTLCLPQAGSRPLRAAAFRPPHPSLHFQPLRRHRQRSGHRQRRRPRRHLGKRYANGVEPPGGGGGGCPLPPHGAPATQTAQPAFQNRPPHTHTHTRHRRRHHASASFSPPGREPPAPAAAFENKAAVRKPPGGCVLGRPGSYAKSAEAGPAPSARRAHGSALTAALRKARRRRGGKNAHLTQGGGGAAAYASGGGRLRGSHCTPRAGAEQKGGTGTTRRGRGSAPRGEEPGGWGSSSNRVASAREAAAWSHPGGALAAPPPPPPCSRFLLPTALSWAFLGFSLRAKLQFSL